MKGLETFFYAEGMQISCVRTQDFQTNISAIFVGHLFVVISELSNTTPAGLLDRRFSHGAWRVIVKLKCVGRQFAVSRARMSVAEPTLSCGHTNQA